MVKKIPKVSRIYDLPVVKKTKHKKSKIKEIENLLPVQMIMPKKGFEEEHKNLSLLLYQKLYYLNKGNYKKYKQAQKMYAEYAVKNYEAVKTLPKEKIPQITILGFSPLLPFYAIRYARIFITDLFRKKTPAEKELLRLAKERSAKKKM